MHERHKKIIFNRLSRALDQIHQVIHDYRLDDENFKADLQDLNNNLSKMMTGFFKVKLPIFRDRPEEKVEVVVQAYEDDELMIGASISLIEMDVIEKILIEVHDISLPREKLNKGEIIEVQGMTCFIRAKVEGL